MNAPQAFMTILGCKDVCLSLVRQRPRCQKGSGEPYSEAMRTSGASATLHSTSQTLFRRRQDSFLGRSTRVATVNRLSSTRFNHRNRACAH